MGGQACVFYGAAEFSRDTDVALLASPENLERLRRALEELDAEVIAVPPLEMMYLERGHAVHFRCHHPDVKGMRLDVMSKMRGVADFPVLWDRRTTAELDGGAIDLLALQDLIIAKKTQRDKDWPMIRRLVEAHYLNHEADPNADRILFWLSECRTPKLLRELGRRFPEALRVPPACRLWIADLEVLTDAEIENALASEEQRQRLEDKQYWQPLRAELEQLRRGRNQRRSTTDEH